MEKSIRRDALELGVCYYPEHWDESLWRDDLRRMRVHGIGTVRVFEFAWSVVEPREGEYDFSLFDRFLALGGGGIHAGHPVHAHRHAARLADPRATPRC